MMQPYKCLASMDHPYEAPGPDQLLPSASSMKNAPNG